MTILEKIVNDRRKKYEAIINKLPLENVKQNAEAMDCNTGFPFEKALQKEEISFICEVKKASPSKGIIAKDFPYIDIAKDYEKAGASAISCLTEPTWFKGKDKYLSDITQEVSIPVLRKDFIFSSYQIYEAKTLGASAILLICALLSTEELKQYIAIADGLGLSALVEAHTETEVNSAIESGARVIGVNNRNLKDFSVDINTCINLRKLVPQNIMFIAESGIKTTEDINKLKEANVNGVLIGETLMKSKDKKAMLEQLNGGEIK